MKRKFFCLVAVTAVGASLMTGAKAQDVDVTASQNIVNRRINEQVINRAILHQATRGRKHAVKGRAAHHVTRHIKWHKSK
jgi:hypothetical protein